MTTLSESKNEVFDYVRYSLGDGMVDVELDPVHYEMAFKQAMLRYRQRSSNAVEESYSFLELQVNNNIYKLPTEVINVRSVFKRSIGSSSTGSTFDPFQTSASNFYMLQGGTGGLATYAFYSMFLKEAAKMFGGLLNFQFNSVTKQLTIMRNPRAEKETILLWTDNYKPDITILNDTYSQPWLRDYTLGICMKMLGQARSKFASLPGPSGGSQLNGAQLLTDGQAIIDKLELEVTNYMEGSTPAWFVIG